MAVIQSDIEELRFIRRQNLNEEAKVMGNYYRDLIRQFGIDCTYYKLDTSTFNEFKTTIDRNAILKRAYGVEQNPDYTMSADMVTYVTVDQDVFALNKIGLVPQVDVEFVFDSNDFACALATKLGQYREYKIEDTEIVCEVPSPEEVSDESPYELQLGYNDTYKCKMLQGRFQALLGNYELGKEYTITCLPYEHTQFKVQFPVNDELYWSLKHKIESDDFLETLLRLTFKVDRVVTRKLQHDHVECKYVLSGKLHGSILFFDIDSIGKYVEKIHPSVGDIVEIDFPDRNNREKYEITECIDKQLTPDGINPLMHKYVWKCKAKRYINSHEDLAPELNEADKRIQERQDYDAMVQEEVAKNISLYPDNEDDVYGGMDGVIKEYDKQRPEEQEDKRQKYECLDENSAIVIMKFACGSKLVTDGYELIFVDKQKNAYIVAKSEIPPNAGEVVFESGLRWLKSTESQIVFVNIEGQSTVLAKDSYVPEGELQICLNDLHTTTLDDFKELNHANENFIKFKDSRSLIWATEDHLYAKVASNKTLFKLV